MEKIFENIYESSSWASNYRSGSGSTFESTIEYRQVLRNILYLSKIKTVVDLGCGNWDFYHDEFNNVQYTGYDCVSKVIEINRSTHGETNNRKFLQADFSSPEFQLSQKVDLIILKDVLQHLSNETVIRILQMCIKYSRYILITNDVHWEHQPQDCQNGGHRFLSIIAPPLSEFQIRPITIFHQKLMAVIPGEGSSLKDLIYSSLVYQKFTERILIAILARNKAYCLDKYLTCLENLDYPKDQIVIYIDTNNNDDNTLRILEEWSQKHKFEYSSIIFNAHHVLELESETSKPHDWTDKKTSILGEIRNNSLQKTLETGCDYYFVIDCDNFLTNPYTLKELILARLPIVGPMIRSMINNTYYPNYWCEVDQNWFYQNSDKQFEILNWSSKGIHEVAVVHCTYLVDAKVIPNLSYTRNRLEIANNYEFIIFIRSAIEAKIERYICNKHFYGFIHFARDQTNLETEAADREFISKFIN